MMGGDMIGQLSLWGHDIDKAREDAKKTGKLILLFFHTEFCSSCTLTIEKTLPDVRIMERLSDRYIPQMSEVTAAGKDRLSKQYSVYLTPTFIVTDGEGNEVHRWEGYWYPEEFLAQLVLAEGKAAMLKKDYDGAIKKFSTIKEKCPDTEAAPEALYDLGVSIYNKEGNEEGMRAIFNELHSRYPDSSWSREASAWRR